LEEHLIKVLGSLDDAVKEHPPTLLLGSSGSFDSIVDMAHFKYGTDRKALANPIENAHFYGLFDALIGSTKNERLLVPGLQPLRADFMVIAMIMIKFTLNRYQLTRIHQSNYALKEGVLFELAKKMTETE
jgi:exopolyphosphatase/guanosine-5'-triphosphate,3'-diphosphate pyrophosphatase